MRADVAAALPTGRPGRLLALGITLLVLGLAWFAAVAPLIDWYRDRSENLARRRTYAQHMADLAAQLPALRQRAASLGNSGPAASAVLRGASDAIAGAELQELVQAMASRENVTLTSTETLPVVAAGAYRRIGLRISLSAPYAVVVRLLQAIAEASPRMLVDDVELQGSLLLNRPADAPVDAHLTVLAFRPAAGDKGKTP